MWPFGKSTEEQIKEQLQQYTATKNLNLNIQERGGNVSISGEVQNAKVKNLLQIAIQNVKGVKSVDLSGVWYPETTQAQPAAQHEVQTQQTQQTRLPSGNLPSVSDDDIRQAEESSQIAKQVLAALESNVELKDDAIAVLQTGRSVILKGAVDSDHEVRLAEKIARETPGVASVDASGLRVEQGARQKYQEERASVQQTRTGQQGYVNKPDAWHTVQAGETLSEIALHYYHDASRESYMKIARANGISDPDKIRVGQKLQIPM